MVFNNHSFNEVSVSYCQVSWIIPKDCVSRFLLACLSRNFVIILEGTCFHIFEDWKKKPHEFSNNSRT